MLLFHALMTSRLVRAHQILARIHQNFSMYSSKFYEFDELLPTYTLTCTGRILGIRLVIVPRLLTLLHRQFLVEVIHYYWRNFHTSPQVCDSQWDCLARQSDFPRPLPRYRQITRHKGHIFLHIHCQSCVQCTEVCMQVTITPAN